jgi:hypothetical protein
MRRSCSVLAVLAQSEHSAAFSYYSLADDTMLPETQDQRSYTSIVAVRAFRAALRRRFANAM